jgi:hypothetical protein
VCDLALRKTVMESRAGVADVAWPEHSASNYAQHIAQISLCNFVYLIAAGREYSGLAVGCVPIPARTSAHDKLHETSTTSFNSSLLSCLFFFR